MAEISVPAWPMPIHQTKQMMAEPHPTGEFRNIRRFAFVIHPLSQEYIRKGFPLPKATPKL